MVSYDSEGGLESDFVRCGVEHLKCFQSQGLVLCKAQSLKESRRSLRVRTGLECLAVQCRHKIHSIAVLSCKCSSTNKRLPWQLRRFASVGAHDFAHCPILERRLLGGGYLQVAYTLPHEVVVLHSVQC